MTEIDLLNDLLNSNPNSPASKGEMLLLRLEMKSEFKELRSDMNGLKVELRSEMNEITRSIKAMAEQIAILVERSVSR